MSGVVVRPGKLTKYDSARLASTPHRRRLPQWSCKEGLSRSHLNAEAYEGKAKGKADVTINLFDDTFIDLADGKVNGQKAFMSGKLKVKGNIMLATKLDNVLKSQKAKL
ncbi:uncharacterized protein UDID_17233 [Ustilago sp. UG-2017a]|nr:uncharacterized protein UDID_17233 [Ustilago sp. UG-2017a]